MALALGIVLGLALETRGTLLLTVPFLLPFLRHRRRVLLGAVVVFMPWIARNAVTLHAFIPFSTGSGHVLRGANNEFNPPGAWQWAITFPDWPHFAGLDEVAQDRGLTRAALDFLRTQTIPELLARAQAKLIYLFSSPTGIGALLVMTATLLRRNFSRPMRLCLVLWAGLALNTVIFWGDARFVFPVWSTVAIAAGLILKETHC